MPNSIREKGRFDASPRGRTWRMDLRSERSAGEPASEGPGVALQERLRELTAGQGALAVLDRFPAFAQDEGYHQEPGNRVGPPEPMPQGKPEAEEQHDRKIAADRIF